MPSPAEVAAHHFVRPRRAHAAAAPTPPTTAAARWLALPTGELRYWIEGEGRPVLLVHGWEGQPADQTAFANALRNRGQAIAWVELPAHGQSTIAWTSVPHAASALARLGETLGPVRGVIAHSVGGALATLALGQGLRADRVVLIGAPAEYRDYARAFALQAGLDAEGTAAMSHVLREQYGIDVDRVSTPAAARGLAAAALVIHSRDDAVVPFRDAERITAAWPGAVLHAVDGLGHRRVLADPAAVAAAVDHACA
jgi:pimeloyl-ACP methyl ester carboxylesterase